MCVQRIQKVLTQMNIQLANVISDVSGLTGQTIVRAILAGERDPCLAISRRGNLPDYQILKLPNSSHCGFSSEGGFCFSSCSS
jgi:hypothetical protein